MDDIALILGLNKSTVSRTLHRAVRTTCPFGQTCDRCVLPECGIKTAYAHLLNNDNVDLRKKREDYLESVNEK